MKSRSFEKSFYYAIVSLLSSYTAWKVSKYGVISGLHFPVLGLNTGKYGPEITLYLDNFHAVWVSLFSSLLISSTYSDLWILYRIHYFPGLIIFCALFFIILHCVKSVQIRSYFWSAFSHIWTEYRKIRTRNNSVFGHFSRSHSYKDFFSFLILITRFLKKI